MANKANHRKAEPKIRKKVIRQHHVSFLKHHWLPALILYILATALYLPSINYDYVLDDKIVLEDNAYVKKGFDGLNEIFSTESFQGYFGEQKNLVQGARYRPLSIATFALENGIVGENNKRISHLINALLYGILCLIIYRVLVLLFNDKVKEKWFFSIAFAASLIYVFHPVHIEAVANIKGRDEILCMLFSMVSLIFGIKYFDTKKYIHLVLMSVSFFLGILAKENAITFLAVIPLSLYFFRKTNYKRILTCLAPLVITTVIYLILRIQVIGYLFDDTKEITDIMNDPFYGMSGSEKLATIVYTLGEYFKLSFLPIQLTHDYYPYHVPIMNWTKPGTIISMLLYLAIIVVSIIGLRSKKIWAYGFIFYIATLSIASNLVFSIGTFMNERFLFIPSLGICILIAWFFTKFMSDKVPNQYKWWPLSLVILLSSLFLVKDYFRIPAWKNTMSLNRSAIKVSKESARANLFMGVALFEEYKLETDPNRKAALLNEAEPYLDKAIEIYPIYGHANQMKSGILAERYKSDRNLNKLLSEFKKIIARRPVAFVDQYLEFLNNRPTEVNTLVNFYNDVGFNVIKRNADQERDPQRKAKMYRYALKYLNYGLSLDPSNATLQQNINRINALLK